MTIVSGTCEERGEWVLLEMEKAAPDVDAILRVLDGMAAEGAETEVRSFCDLLMDSLLAKGNRVALVRVLILRTALSAVQAGWSAVCRGMLEKMFGDRAGKAFIASIGMEAPQVAIAESLRRLLVLLELQEGAYCLDRTWGFGIVRRVDDFYQKVTLDFRRRPGHQMSFAYAAEALRVIDREHLLAHRQDHPEALRALVAERSDEVVRMALRSYGPLTAVDLQDLLSREEIVPEAEWKAFWDRARKALKADPLVDVPSKRSEHIRLLASEKNYAESWMETFQEERDAKRIYTLTEELRGATDPLALPRPARLILADRIHFGIMGAESSAQFALAAKLLLQADTCGFRADGVTGKLDMGRLAATFMGADRLFKTCADLSPGDVGRLLELLGGYDRETLCRSLLGSLYVYPAHVLDQALPYLLAHGDQGLILEDLARHFREDTSGGAVLAWYCRHLDQVVEWRLATLMGLIQAVIRELELPAELERRRNQKILRGIFEDKDWIEDMLPRLDVAGRESLMIRIRESRGWEETAKRTVMARMIKVMPELGEVAAAEKRGRVERKEVRWTSWRTFAERQEQLRVLLEVSIPENSREIGVARSYGDLRENFEYQAAKDHQRLLMQRKVEFERDLGEVRGTDFRDVRSDVAGMGTGVELARPNGTVERYWILGEWDRDEALGIISNRSEMAKAMEGLAAGAGVTLPGDPPGTASVLRAVFPMDDRVKAWIQVRPGVAAAQTSG